jgi:hypothetical protein
VILYANVQTGGGVNFVSVQLFYEKMFGMIACLLVHEAAYL